MLKRFLVTAMLTAALVLPLASAQAASTELVISSAWYERHPGYVNYWIPWMETIRKETEGRVNPQYFSPNTLINEKEVWSGVVNGTLGFSWGMTGKTPGKFPLNSLPELPMLVTSVTAGAHVVWDLYEKFPAWRGEFKDAKMIGQFVTPPMQIFTTKKQIKTLEDLKGLKLITFTPIATEIFQTLGANPISVLPTEVYLALERGMADGVVNTLVAARAEKNTEIAKYTTLVGVSSGAFFVAMNQDTWNELSDADKKVFENLGGARLADELGGVMDASAISELELMKQEGQTVYTLPQQEVERWMTALQPLYAKWVKDMEAKGVANAQEILDTAIELSKKYSN